MHSLELLRLYFVCLFARSLAAAAGMGMMNPAQIMDGKLIPSDGPGWGVAWDMAQFAKNTVEIV